jgi:EAL domain-containing protein (putative c-di-GMP-specific phosphodiesterase class I)
MLTSLADLEIIPTKCVFLILRTFCDLHFRVDLPPDSKGSLGSMRKNRSRCLSILATLMNSDLVLSNKPLSTASRRFSPVESKTVWILASVGQQISNALTVVHPVPFSIGRKAGCSLQLPSKTVSSHHADLTIRDGHLVLIDRQSTNGTYVNGRRVTDMVGLKSEDLVQFADMAFRVRCDDHATAFNTVAEDVCDQALALVQFDRLMEKRLVTPFFQPIVTIDGTGIVGYEVLARSRMFGLETSAALFGAAAKLNMEVELSQMLRWEGIREGLNLPGRSRIYVNTHPLELGHVALIESMAKVRDLTADLPITLEIHESAVTSSGEMYELRNQLRDLDIEIAYDDFGAGQNRLAELCNAAPDVLKFDMGLIRDIDKAPPERIKVLRSLVQIVLDLGVQPLAEGIENEKEAKVCSELGFTLAQGYHFGRPAPLSKYLSNFPDLEEDA